jgi:hypothetical protein
MDRSDIAEAITLFKFSKTAHLSPRAATVVKTLDNLYRRDEIGGYRAARPKYGQWDENSPGPDLGVNTRTYERIPKEDRPAYLSLELVHEGSHAADKLDDVYSELAARLLTTHYYITGNCRGPAYSTKRPTPRCRAAAPAPSAFPYAAISSGISTRAKPCVTIS